MSIEERSLGGNIKLALSSISRPSRRLCLLPHEQHIYSLYKMLKRVFLADIVWPNSGCLMVMVESEHPEKAKVSAMHAKMDHLAEMKRLLQGLHGQTQDVQ